MGNVIIILADQHRQDCLGVYGNTEIKTPHIDALANDSMVYTHHFCSYPVCTPSRYSFLSGMYTHQHLGGSNHCTLPQGIATFASIFKKNAYHTTAVGKMHFTPTYLDVGFEKMILSEQDGVGRFDDDYHRFLKANNLIDDIDITDQRMEYRANATEEYFNTFGAKASDLPEEYHSTSYITENALHEIENWDTQNHLLMVGYIKPHHPFDPPKRYLQQYEDAAPLTPLDGYTAQVPEADYQRYPGYFDNAKLTPERLQKVMAMYYATITQIDDGVGKIIEKLRQKKHYDDTLIVYTSDHGEYMGFHHMLLKGNFMYDPLIKIPLIIKYPHQAKIGTCDTLSSNVDVAAEILKQCGINPPETMSAAGLHTRKMVIIEQGNEYAVRSERYKLMVREDFSNIRFFDLQKDPFEYHDEAKNALYSEKIQQHKEFLANEILFRASSRTHLSYDAPVINGLTPEQIEEQRQPIRSYFKEKSAAFRVKP